MPSAEKTELVMWNIAYCTPPTVLHYCKKCGRMCEFVSSGEFRVNAQQKSLDIWLIYKCIHCQATWNSAIYAHISPQYLAPALLEQFHSNDENLAWQYAMDTALLQKNGGVIKMPAYQIIGEAISLEKPVRVKIQSLYHLPLKVSAILRKKLGISQRELNALLLSKRIAASTGQDLMKCRLSSDITITIS